MPFICMVLLPAAAGLLLFGLRKRDGVMRTADILYALLQMIPPIGIYMTGGVSFAIPLTGKGLEISFASEPYQLLFLVMTSVIFALLSVYTAGFVKDREYGGRYLLYLHISLSMINGAILSNNLGGMLFFWEGLLCTEFLTLMINNREKPETAIKALIVSGTADLLLMGGIIATGIAAGTLTMTGIRGLAPEGAGLAGFILMFLGAAGKAGCMPFHSWIPNAADDAPLPFLAAFPGAMEKILGIYLSVRIVFDFYAVGPGSPLSVLMMSLGVATILFAVAMALIQKDMKRLLAYHAVSQVGYMVLGIGTCLPVGVVGGLAHMLNHVIYKSCLFMTSGAIEKRTGTTDARKLGGLAGVMPVTCFCFTMSALAISGVPPFNGFFSKELIFHAALECGVIYYIGALLGAVLTAISFLKLGRALFTGETRLPAGVGREGREADTAMLIPMCVMAAASLLLGLFNRLPIDGLFGKVLGQTEQYGGWPKSALLVVLSLLALGLAAADHIYGCRKTGAPIKAADHIHEAPVLSVIYAWAQKGVFDPYCWLQGIMNGFSFLCVKTEQGVSWFYDRGVVSAAKGLGTFLSSVDNGALSRYVGFAFLGLFGMGMVMLICLL